VKPKKPKPIVLPVVISDDGMVFSLDPQANTRLRAQFVAACRKWPNGPAELELRPFEETRRGRANRYYRGVVLRLIAEESGHSADDLHEYFKLRHNSKTVADPATGEELKLAVSTAKLTIQAFSDYLNAVMLDGAEMLGIVFPEPRESEDWREKGKAA